MTRSEHDLDLIQRYFAGDLDEPAERAFWDAVASDESFARRVTAYSMLESQLIERRSVAAPSAPPAAPHHTNPILLSFSGAGPLARSLAAAVLIAAVVIAIYVVSIAPRSGGPGTRSTAPVATLVESSDGSTVIYEDDIARNGGEYAAGTYSMRSGSAQFLLTSGASVTMNGDTELILHDKMNARLARGSVAFVCPPSAVGFTVHLPGGTRVVDLGTRFNIDVDHDGGSRVVVNAGSVRIEPAAGEPIVLTRGDIVAIARDPQRPVRLLGTVIADVGGDWVDATVLPDGWGYFDATATTGGTLTPLTPSYPVGNAGNRGFSGRHNAPFNLGAVLGERNGGSEFELFVDGYEHHAAVPGVDLLVHPGSSSKTGGDGNNYILLRYTVRESDLKRGGAAVIAGSFRQLVDGGGDSITASIYHNDARLFVADGRAPGSDGSPSVLSAADGSFSLDVTLAPGDTVDFVVFNNGDFATDETAIRGKITIQPETETRPAEVPSPRTQPAATDIDTAP